MVFAKKNKKKIKFVSSLHFNRNEIPGLICHFRASLKNVNKFEVS